MVKCTKVVVCGMKGVGKTCILEQVIYGNVTKSNDFFPTIEDIYVANIETDRGTKEKLRFYDTAGIEQSKTAGTTSQQLPRHYLILADAYLLVYDTERPESLEVIVQIKKDIDKNKDKKEVIIVVLGNKTKESESNDFETTINKTINWCSREKIKHFTANSMVRESLFDCFMFLSSKLNPPQNKSTFPQLSMGRKTLSKDSNG